MSYLLTFLLTLAVVSAAVWVFVRVGTPVYRLEPSNLISLFELVLAGEASENDWQVFIGIPLRHDIALRDVQRRCQRLTETEYLGAGGAYLFSPRGLQELESMLRELKAEEGADQDHG